MYPIDDTDPQLLLATLIASKRRPAQLVEIVAAAELLGCPVVSEGRWADSLRRLSAHSLILRDELGGLMLSAEGQELVVKLPKRVEPAEHLFLVRERLKAFEPASPAPAIVVPEEDFRAAVMAHGLLSRQGGDNLFMPKPKVQEEPAPRRGGFRRSGGGRR